jgi:tRNA(adenine34) deaminase
MADEGFMRQALQQAMAAGVHNDVPVGAVLVKDGEVVATAGNERRLRNDPTAHAEILVLRAAAEKLGTWRLAETSLYVTLEPCAMCAGALVLGRVSKLIYGPQDPKAGAALSLYNIVQDPRLNHELEIVTGVLEEECATVLRDFFKGKRSGPPL